MVDLEKTISLIKQQKNVIHTPMQEQENVNDDVELHTHIDGIHIEFHLLKFIAPPILSSGKDGWGFFCLICDYNTLINCGLNLCPTFLLHVKKWVEHFFAQNL